MPAVLRGEGRTMIALRLARGDAALLQQGVRRCRPWCTGERVIHSPFSVSAMPTQSPKNTFCENRRLRSRALPLRAAGPSPVRVAMGRHAVSVLHRDVHSTSAAGGSADKGKRHPGDSISVTEVSERIVAPMKQMLADLQANLNERKEDVHENFDLQLLTDHGPTPIVEPWTGGIEETDGMLAGGRREGMNGRALHAEMHRHMGSVMRFAIWHKKGKDAEENEPMPEKYKRKTGILTPDDPHVEDDRLDEMDTSRMTWWEYAKHSKNKLARAYKRYFWVAFGTYWALYLGGFGSVYGLLASGIVDPGISASQGIGYFLDFTGMEKFSWVSEHARNLQVLADENPQAEKGIMAFAVNEVIELPREVLVLTFTPAIARYFGKAPPKVVRVTTPDRPRGGAHGSPDRKGASSGEPRTPES